MCKYKEICPTYDEFSERCTEILERRDCVKCIPLLLEAYHAEKETDYEVIRRYL